VVIGGLPVERGNRIGFQELDAVAQRGRDRFTSDPFCLCPFWGASVVGQGDEHECRVIQWCAVAGSDGDLGEEPEFPVDPSGGLSGEGRIDLASVVDRVLTGGGLAACGAQWLDHATAAIAAADSTAIALS
jgi:hypothetical protein